MRHAKKQGCDGSVMCMEGHRHGKKESTELTLSLTKHSALVFVRLPALKVP